MTDKVFGLDFSNDTAPTSSYTLSLNNGTILVDVTVGDLLKLVSANTPRNLLMNGAMEVAQRGTSTAGITTKTSILDRWVLNLTTLGTWTGSQQADAPSGYPLTNSMKLLVTTAKASPAAGDVAIMKQSLEGQFCQSVLKGTSSAKQLTLSFWVKSSTTGTYIAELVDVTNTRSVSASYTISAANTWENKTITFPADTTGVITADSNAGFAVNFWLACGTTFTSGTLATTWAATTSANRAVGQTNLAGTLNNYIQFTGTQLELGGAASAYEFLPFDYVLHQCLRYYQKTFPYATTPAQNAGVGGAIRGIAGKAGAAAEFVFWVFQKKLRAAPSAGTVTSYNPSAANTQVRDSTASADCSSVVTNASANSEDRIAIGATGNASTAVGNALDIHISVDVEF